jgi:hypothetical protein
MTLKSVKKLENIQKTITSQQLTNVGYPTFYKKTPILTGNARRHTTKTTNSIDANYPYAKRLDEGYSSQSREGMVKPTIEVIREYIRKQLGV